jgi:hypothetical protein
MRLKLILALLVLLFAFLWFRSREAAALLKLKNKQAKTKEEIKELKKEADNAKTDYSNALNKFRDLYEQYQRQRRD